MKPRILITGNNMRIIENVLEHLEGDQGYRVEKCVADKYELQDMIRRIKPHFAVVCTSDESKETVKTYDVLRECNYFSGIPVIVIANKEDLGVFKENTALQEVHYLPRPVSILALYNILFTLENEMGLAGMEEDEDEDDDFGYQDEEDTYDDEEDRKKHVLVVDDEPEQLSIIKGHLKDFYEVTAVRYGEDALDYIDKHHVDLVLLDFMMPKMTGPDVLYKMRTKRAFANIPVIFLTGMSDRETIVKTLVELRPQGYVLKPVKKSDLVARIIDVIG